MSLLAVNPLDAHSLLQSFGTFGLFVVLFAETGLLIGFFLPGDSLLVTAGLVAALPASNPYHLNVLAVLLAGVLGAIIGGQTGYLIGRRAGPTLLARQRNRRLHEGADRASALLERYGYGRALVLARFVPLVRTVLNPLAGIVAVPARTFALWNVVGGLLWAVGITLAGYVLGSAVEGIDRFLLPIIGVIVVLSLIPVVLETRRHRRSADGRRGQRVE